MITGELAADRAPTLVDADGISMAGRCRCRAVGRPPGRDDWALARLGCFVELHIEQGRGLVEQGQAVGVGAHLAARTLAAGLGRGQPRRHDQTEDRHVTIGCARGCRRPARGEAAVAWPRSVDRVRPGAVNGIASSATAWLDVRGRREAVRAVARWLPS